MIGKPLRHDRKRFFIRHADARDYGVVPDAGGIVSFGVGEDSNSYHLWLQGIHLDLEPESIFSSGCLFLFVSGSLFFLMNVVLQDLIKIIQNY